MRSLALCSSLLAKLWGHIGGSLGLSADFMSPHVHLMVSTWVLSSHNLHPST